MSKKILLLDTNYQVDRFIGLRKAIKHIINDKVEIISNWNDFVYFGNGKIAYPSILRLKNPFKKNYFNSNFSRSALVKRDKSTCQYCLKKLSASNVTIDHVVPRAQGGVTSFTNCVVACQICNNKKADKTPDQANMLLSKKPTNPFFTSLHQSLDPNEPWHSEWNDYLNI